MQEPPPPHKFLSKWSWSSGQWSANREHDDYWPQSGTALPDYLVLRRLSSASACLGHQQGSSSWVDVATAVQQHIDHSQQQRKLEPYFIYCYNTASAGNRITIAFNNKYMPVLLIVRPKCTLRWPHHMLPPGETQWVRRRDTQADGRQTITLHFLLDAASIISKYWMNYIKM